MNGFFKPLRRKFGVVTLLVACVFMASWVRSALYEDVAKIRRSEKKAFLIGSTKYGIVLSAMRVIDENFKWPATSKFVWKSHIPQQKFTAKGMMLGWSLCQLFEDFEYGTDEDPAQMKKLITWNWSYGGFHISQATFPPRIFVVTWIFPHWSIVISLALLSAYFLLSKPRSKSSSPEVDRG